MSTNAPPALSPCKQAQRLLDAARQEGNRRREGAALADLGIASLRGGESERALANLEESLAIAREFGDRDSETDVIGYVGLALLAVGKIERARELLELHLAYARAAGNLLQEKIALTHLGIYHASVREYVSALADYEQALAIARKVGDRKHEADILWVIAVQHAELGERDDTVATAEAALALFASLGNPYTRELAESLQKFRRGESALVSEPMRDSMSGGFFGTWSIGNGVPAQADLPRPVSGPGLLRMAFSATKSIAKFLASGFKAVPDATHDERLKTCTTCEHFTGVRCRVCGCFANVKAWLPHEDCPIGKWPVPKSITTKTQSSQRKSNADAE